MPVRRMKMYFQLTCGHVSAKQNHAAWYIGVFPIQRYGTKLILREQDEQQYWALPKMASQNYCPKVLKINKWEEK